MVIAAALSLRVGIPYRDGEDILLLLSAPQDQRIQLLLSRDHHCLPRLAYSRNDS